MATLKHINSKNADYGAAEQYLLFEHDEFTMKPVLDETGRLIPREDYRLSTLNCGGEDFAVACMRANLRYGKNQRREDVKSHHYIISFDPRDGPDNGLTVDRAQALGEKFCAEHFPGHQALVCTHPDGHNHSGNIHVHIVINSLRIEEVPFLPYMDRPADTKAGCKHRCTDAALRYFKSEVMEMCHREGLYQIDLLNGSKNRVTDREYWAQKKGQAALDKQNAPMIAGGITPRQTKFETNKYQTVEDRKAKKELYEATISMPEMARLLGISRKDVYALLKSKRYGKYFSTVIIADQKRITKDSFQKFLDEQEEYQLSPCNDYKELAMEENVALANFRRKKLLQSGNRRCNGNLNYLTPEEAALMAKVSRSTIVNWYQREEFPIIHIGRRPYFLIIPCIYAFTNSCCRLSIEFQSFSSSS